MDNVAQFPRMPLDTTANNRLLWRQRKQIEYVHLGITGARDRERRRKRVQLCGFEALLSLVTVYGPHVGFHPY